MSSSLSTFIGSLFSTEPIYNETPPPEPEKEDAPAEEAEETANENAPPAEQEEEEEEDPEDPAPALREECSETTACAPFKQHFDHCNEKVADGKGFKHEDCVEELFHLMHCVDNCIAPRLFNKLV